VIEEKHPSEGGNPTWGNYAFPTTHYEIQLECSPDYVTLTKAEFAKLNRFTDYGDVDWDELGESAQKVVMDQIQVRTKYRKPRADPKAPRPQRTLTRRAFSKRPDT
jgi:hypothetical protein